MTHWNLGRRPALLLAGAGVAVTAAVAVLTPRAPAPIAVKAVAADTDAPRCAYSMTIQTCLTAGVPTTAWAATDLTRADCWVEVLLWDDTTTTVRSERFRCRPHRWSYPGPELAAPVAGHNYRAEARILWDGRTGYDDITTESVTYEPAAPA